MARLISQTLADKVAQLCKHEMDLTKGTSLITPKNLTKNPCAKCCLNYFMKIIIPAMIAFTLAGCDFPSTSLASPGTVKSVEKPIKDKDFYYIKLQGPATPTDIQSWKADVEAMCQSWVPISIYSVYVSLQSVSKGTVLFTCLQSKIKK